MQPDKREDLLVRILAAHKSFYDIRRDYRYEGRVFPAFAEFHTFGEQYVLVKRAKLWEVNTHDFMFFEFADDLDAAALEDLIGFMTEKAIKKVAAGSDHMSSGITLVVLANSASDEACKLVKRTRFRKNYRLGFHGWADLRLAMVDFSRPEKKQVFTNGAGVKLKPTLEQNLALVRTGHTL